MSSTKQFPVLEPNLQVSLYSRLQPLRTQYLREGLKAAIEDKGFDLGALDSELVRYVPAKWLKRLAGSGLRGDVVFPVPYLIKKSPFLLGYYRLLFGFSQKAFYQQGPFSSFRGLEERGQVPARLEAALGPLCRSMVQTAGLLLDALEPVTLELVRDLQLLTLGAQLRGARNVDVGQVAVHVVFDLLKDLLAKYSPDVKARTMAFTNDSGHPVVVRFGGDPDVTVVQRLPSGERKLVAIEIKGGADVSNIWNRLGEAEKSHRTAKAAGFNELWTVTGVDLRADRERQQRATEKSPTTTRFFCLPRVCGRNSNEAVQFRQQLGSIMGANLGS